jgi:hypothetical protein
MEILSVERRWAWRCLPVAAIIAKPEKLPSDAESSAGKHDAACPIRFAKGKQVWYKIQMTIKFPSNGTKPPGEKEHR